MNERGSFIVEATLLFPFIVMCTVLILIAGLMLYEKASLQQQAASTAERAAFAWDNSFKDPATGAFSINRNDGLYWRQTSDSLVDLFRLGKGEQSDWLLPSIASAETLTLPQKKLAQAAAWLPPWIAGKLSYTNHWFDRTIQVRLSRPFPIADPFSILDKSEDAQSVSHVVEPAEAIRTVDLFREYYSRLRQFLAHDGGQNDGDDIPAPQPAPEPPVVIRSEKEASEYVRKLVGGHAAEIGTPETGYYRKIDALDGDGVAHEAKYTINLTEAKRQIRKDVELMRSGAVKGVVWHFFKVQKTGKVQLSSALREELERNGIVVIIHRQGGGM